MIDRPACEHVPVGKYHLFRLVQHQRIGVHPHQHVGLAVGGFFRRRGGERLVGAGQFKRGRDEWIAEDGDVLRSGSLTEFHLAGGEYPDGRLRIVPPNWRMLSTSIRASVMVAAELAQVAKIILPSVPQLAHPRG